MRICLRRREFIAAIGGAAVAWPLAADAQQPIPVVGLLISREPGEDSYLVSAFRQGLDESGFLEGRNVRIEYRWAGEKGDRWSASAADLVRRKVNVIGAIGDGMALTAQRATASIPTIFVTGVDPVEFGLVLSLNRPGGNRTGVSMLNAELGPKRLQLLRELIPSAAAIGLLINSAVPTAETLLREHQAAARTLGLDLHVVHASTEAEINGAFETMAHLRADGVVIGTGGLFNRLSEQIATLGLRYALPTIYQYRAFAAAGGLMSYGASLADGTRLAGAYTGRVLKGEKPGDLPVQQATKVELIINLKTARALGITVPLTLRGRADELIE
jgi:putative ABC transport system substrate-binding protein